MKPERWKEIERIFHAVLEREPAERESFPSELPDKSSSADSLRMAFNAGLLLGNSPAITFSITIRLWDVHEVTRHGKACKAESGTAAKESDHRPRTSI